MLRKTVSGIMLTLLFIGTLTLAFSVQPVKASYPINSMTPVSKSKERQVTVSFSIPQATKIGRYDWLKIENCSYFTKPGQPMLPVRSVVVKLPKRSTVTNVRAKVKEMLLEGSLSILPVPSPTTVGSQTPAKISEDPTIYTSKSLFPKEWYVYRESHGMDAETNMRFKYLILNLFPLRFLPTENKVIRAEKISVTITYNESPEILTPLTRLKNLIVTSPTLEAYALELAEWKNNTGISSKVLNTTWIYEHYSGVDNQEKIRNCIKDFVATYGVIYVTIFGDADQVPVRYVYVPDDYDTYTPTDLYYADLDGTWDDNGDGLYADQRYDDVDGIPDVYVGRIPPSLAEYAQVAVDKIKGYQQQFDASECWTRRIVLAAGTCSGDGFTNLDKNGTTILKEYIANIVIDNDIVKLYESTGNLSTVWMTSEINKGALFVNFAGHGDPGTGLLAVGWLFYWVIPGLIWNGFGISDVQSLTNGFTLPVVTTMSCSTARFDDTDCIGEWFVLEPDGGSIAYFGATRVAWGYFDELAPYGFMGEMDRRIYENFYEGSTRLGQMWGETVGEYVHSHIWNYEYASIYDVKTFMEFVLLGDPALRIYNSDYPETLNVPEDYPTIQTAINAAYDGDTVLVSAGTYYEHIVVNKTVSVVGESRETTIIDGNRASQAIVQITADDVTFSNFTVQHAGEMGFTNQAEAVYLRGTGISVTYNIIRDNNKGIFIYPPSKSNRIIGNVVTGSYFFGINCGSSNNTISDNLVTRNIPYDGIILTSWMKGYPYPPGEYWPSGGNVLRNNNMTLNGANFGVKYGGTIYNNGLYLPPVSAFVQDIDTSNIVDGKPIYYLVNQSNVEIDDLSFPNVGYFGLVNSKNVTVRDLILTTSNYQGILLVNVTGSAIENVYTHTWRHQISLVWSNSNVITNSTFMNAWSGIHLVGSDNNTIYENDIAYGTAYGSGVRLDKSIGNVIIDNSIRFNEYGIRIFQGSIQNAIYHNNLVSNAIQLDGESSQNVWDNGYEGNCWSDYNGTDINGDGIGDTYLPWHGVDYYPLMNPYCGHNIAIVDVKTNKTIVEQGFTVRIEVDVTNTGSFPETSNLTVYVNTTAIQTQNVTLTSGDSTIINFTWNTTGFALENYTVSAYAWPVPGETDVADNNFTDGWVAIIDNTPPIINIVYPAEGEYIGTVPIVWINGTITETNWMGQYPQVNDKNFTLDMVSWNGTHFSFYNTTVISDCTHSYMVNFTDLAGNTGNATVTFTTDTVYPIVEITYPTDNHYYDSESVYWINGTFIEKNLNLTEPLVINHTGFVLVEWTWNETMYNGTFAFRNDTVTTDDHYYVKVTLTDLASESTSDIVHIHVDTAKPIVTIILPQDDHYFDSEAVIWINGTFVEKNLNTTRMLDINHTGFALADWAWNSATYEGTFAFWNTTALLDGTYHIKASITDLAGKTGYATVYFTVDTIPPNIDMTYPTNGQYLNTSTIRINGTITELNTGNLKPHINDTAFSLVSWDPLTGIFVFKSNTAISDGTISLTVSFTDLAGKTGSDTVYFILDTTPPTIEVLCPTNMTYTTTSVPLNFTLSESPSWMGYSLDGKSNVTVSGNTILTGLSEGGHNLSVYANDTVNNMGASQTVHFTISLTQVFDGVWEGIHYQVTMNSNSTISNFNFNQTKAEISFDVTGESGTVGYCNLTISTDLLWGNYTVYVDGIKVKYAKTSNFTHSFLYFTYNQTTRAVQIQATHVIPEFPGFLILPLFMTATLLVVIVYRRKYSV